MDSNYQQAKQQYYKTTACYFYLRKRCIFSKQRCKYAHGADDLKILPHQQHVQVKNTFLSLKEKRWKEKGIQPKRKEQYKIKSCIDDLLFSSDEEEFSQLYHYRVIKRTDEENIILKNFYVENAYALIKRIMGEKTSIPKKEIEEVAEDVQMHINWKLLAEKCLIFCQNGITNTENKKKVEMVWLYPSREQIDLFIENLLTNIFLSNMHELPLESEDVMKEIYSKASSGFLPIFSIIKHVNTSYSMERKAWKNSYNQYFKLTQICIYLSKLKYYPSCHSTKKTYA